jgi:hypothetical protein
VNAGLVFSDVKGELKRTYIFPNGKIEVINVVRICVRPSGSHRLETAEGRKLIVAAGWNAIEVDAAEWSL